MHLRYLARSATLTLCLWIQRQTDSEPDNSLYSGDALFTHQTQRKETAKRTALQRAVQQVHKSNRIMESAAVAKHPAVSACELSVCRFVCLSFCLTVAVCVSKPLSDAVSRSRAMKMTKLLDCKQHSVVAGQWRNTLRWSELLRNNPLGNLNSGRRPWAKLVRSASLHSMRLSQNHFGVLFLVAFISRFVFVSTTTLNWAVCVAIQQNVYRQSPYGDTERFLTIFLVVCRILDKLHSLSNILCTCSIFIKMWAQI